MELTHQVRETGEEVVIMSYGKTIKLPWDKLSPMLKMSMEAQYDEAVREKADLRKEWREGDSSLSEEEYKRVLEFYNRNLKLIEEKMEHVKVIMELEGMEERS